MDFAKHMRNNVSQASKQAHTHTHTKKPRLQVVHRLDVRVEARSCIQGPAVLRERPPPGRARHRRRIGRKPSRHPSQIAAAAAAATLARGAARGGGLRRLCCRRADIRQRRRRCHLREVGGGGQQQQHACPAASAVVAAAVGRAAPCGLPPHAAAVAAVLRAGAVGADRGVPQVEWPAGRTRELDAPHRHARATSCM